MRVSRFHLQQALMALATIVLAVTAIYFGRPIVLPVVLAVLLAFLLSPIVVWMERWGVGRVLSVIVTVGLSACLVALIGWVLYAQLNDLAQELPSYRQNIRRKIADLRGLRRDSTLEKVQDTVEEVSEELSKTSQEIEAEVESASEPAEPERSRESTWAVPVKIETASQRFSLESLSKVLGPLAAPITMCGIAMVLVVFMLLRREDLRNRLLRLTGDSRLALTTRIMDEVGARISRFLLAQLALNVSFGATIGLGLYVIGLPHALLWGIVAAALRYIPYVGPWIAAGAPILLSLIAYEGWTQLLLVVGLFTVLELLNNNLFEPLLYGRSVGVSPIAVLISAVFWGWLWGPLGLLLSTPIAVCLLVLGRYVPQLQCLYVVLGDEPVLDAAQRYYQRLLARDRREAKSLLQKELAASSPEAVGDALLIPALVRSREERRHGHMDEQDQRYIVETTREIFNELRAASQAVSRDSGHERSRPPPVRVYGCPAGDEVDVTALEILAGLLAPTECELAVASLHALGSEILEQVEQSEASLVCVAALPAHAVSRARYVCRRLRERFPDLRILVGRWGLREEAGNPGEPFESEGVDRVTVTLAETVEQLKRWAPLAARGQNPSRTTAAGPAEAHRQQDRAGFAPPPPVKALRVSSR